MEMKGEEYCMNYDSETMTVTCQGSFRLRRAEYAPIRTLLNEIAAATPPLITLNLRALEYLNSSGINMLSKFVIKVRKLKRSQVVLLGSHEIAWHDKSFRNLKRFMPDLKLEWS